MSTPTYVPSPTPDFAKIERALISVSDKTGLVELGKALVAHGVAILSTGGSAKALRDAGIEVIEVSDHTGFPEIMDGRVKTLQPAIHGGILARRTDTGHARAMGEHKIAAIDLVVVNLYPFEATVARGADFPTCIENIDIGGPALIRASAKNHDFVTVVVDPTDYRSVLDELTAHDGATTLALRRKLAAKAYARTAAYDSAIATWFARQQGETFPERLTLAADRVQTLRYGENPHQRAAFYSDGSNRPGVATARQVQGKELSYNNINDTDAAYECVAEFTEPAVVVIKHANPSGVAVAADQYGAYLKAYARTAAYDSAIATWFARQQGETFPEQLTLAAERVQILRYGENPHQRAAFYSDGSKRPGVATARQVQGKELSYNNINDTDAAYECVAEFTEPAVVVIKHANPSGVAIAADQYSAYLKAYACDPVSIYGGIVAVNRTLEARTATDLAKRFLEVIIAPDATPEALEILARRKDVRVLLAGTLPDPASAGMTLKSVAGGYLFQGRDNGHLDRSTLEVVSKRAPTDKELADLLFAFTVCKHVKSNAIVYARDGATVGVGAGQMNRRDSSRIAALRAAESGEIAKLAQSPAIGSVVASDAFFPFADGLLAAAEAGATAVIQPGGSMRDKEVIAAADQAGLAMVFSGMRHFRH